MTHRLMVCEDEWMDVLLCDNFQLILIKYGRKGMRLFHERSSYESVIYVIMKCHNSQICDKWQSPRQAEVWLCHGKGFVITTPIKPTISTCLFKTDFQYYG